MEYTYCTATSTGKDFFTAEDSHAFYLSPHPGNVWVLENNTAGVSWINRVEGARKTKEEAQAIVDGEVETAQTTWDNLPAEEKHPIIVAKTKVEKYTLK